MVKVLRHDLNGLGKPVKVIECEVCQDEVHLHSGWANTCYCGSEYNGFGQLLAPRSQWGEETGEDFTNDFHDYSVPSDEPVGIYLLQGDYDQE